MGRDSLQAEPTANNSELPKTITVCVNPTAQYINEELDYAIGLLQAMKDSQELDKARLKQTIPNTIRNLLEIVEEYEETGILPYREVEE